MHDFKVTTAELKDAHTYVAELAAEVHSGLGSLEADVHTLLGGGWKGSAATGYAEGWEHWHSAALKILDALGRMGKLLEITAKEYDGRDAVSAVTFEQLDA